MDENKAIIAVQHNDMDAFEYLLETYKDLIHKCVWDLGNFCYGDYSVDKDDLFQEGCIGLYHACLQYVYPSPAKFSTFAYTVIKRRLDRKFRTYCRPILRESYSVDKVDQIDYLSFYCQYDAETSLTQNTCSFYLNKDIETFIKSLKITDQRIIELRCQGYSYQEISLILGSSPKQIDNRISRIKAKLKRRFGNNKTPYS